MKNKINILLLASFILALPLTFFVYYQTTHEIGDISYDETIDNPEFKVCNENYIPQYYHAKTSYQGGKRAIKKELTELVNNLNFKDSGFITYRFVVNCESQTGRFRVKMVDSKLKENTFNPNNVKLIQESIKGLKGWVAGKSNHGTLDSYYVLTFKIENSKITDIF